MRDLFGTLYRSTGRRAGGYSPDHCTAHLIDNYRPAAPIAFAAPQLPFKVEYVRVGRQPHSLEQANRRDQHIVPAGGALGLHEIAGAKIREPGLKEGRGIGCAALLICSV